ncbi:hypothetical protein [Streptomyces sp. NPDC051079]|uniref:hypothetical protein n=1 Tax=Streptomyces sp. NPDC051079 TaxID=3155043 RepID=UPI00344DAD28
MITATIASDVRHVELDVTQNGSAPTIERDGIQVPVTRVRFTYTDSAVTAIRMTTADETVFAHEEDLKNPESWVAWVAQLAETHVPLRYSVELDALDCITNENTRSANALIQSLGVTDRHTLANHLDTYRTLVGRSIQTHG